MVHSLINCLPRTTLGDFGRTERHFTRLCSSINCSTGFSSSSFSYIYNRSGKLPAKLSTGPLITPLYIAQTISRPLSYVCHRHLKSLQEQLHILRKAHITAGHPRYPVASSSSISSGSLSVGGCAYSIMSPISQPQTPATANSPLCEHRDALVERVTDCLETPSLDDRLYRVIKLPNQLEVLLVHDADTDKASAAMDVNVGNFSDPPWLAGASHLIEHMLFMGTKKVTSSKHITSYATER
jgi:hypothetical protein